MLNDLIRSLLGIGIAPAPRSAPTHHRLAASPVRLQRGAKPIRCGDLVALVGFATRAEVVAPFAAATDRRLASAAESLPSRIGGTTAMAEGIELALRLFVGVPRGLHRRVSVLTDGHADSREAARAAAREAAREKVPIDTIGIGGRGKYDEALLRELSATTGGRFRHAGHVAQLDAMFQNGRRVHRRRGDGEAHVFCLDLSGSMTEPFGTQRRIEAVRDALKRLVARKQLAFS